MNKTIEFFPFAKRTKENIEKQNKFLQKISLTGKINALDFSANLFEYTDETIKKFTTLKEELIDALVDESLSKVTSELSLKAQLSIDILKRNLFERTADVRFLSSDREIIKFLEDEKYDKKIIQARLAEYVSKYSVYDDIIIFDTSANAKITLNQENKISSSKDKIINQALNSDSYVEIYRHSDIVSKREKALIYAHKITSNGKNLGVLCLSFKFDDELKKIYKNISTTNDILLLEDSSGVIASSSNSIKKGSKVKLIKGDNYYTFNNKIAFQTQTKGYQDYYGLKWKSTAIALKTEGKSKQILKKQTLPKNLEKIINEAHETVEDLGDVIINGELIASKFRQYTLSPILDNLRIISTSLLEDINNSAENLANLNTDGLLTNTKLSTTFSIDLMDRNLYERANDCRWWALTPEFIEELSSNNPDTNKIHKILQDINILYEVYTNIIIYDKNATIIAASQDQSVVGKTINSTAASSTLQNKDSQKYFVSNFETNWLYNDKPTYVYHASISNESYCVGGIGIVFDAELEFKNILEESLLEGKKSFYLFCNKDKQIISSTNPDLNPLDKIDLPTHYFSSNKTLQEFITYKDTNYLLTVVKSDGYREYKNEDNYKNEVYALSFMEV